MIRKEAIRIIMERVGGSPVVSANGFISRDLFEVCDSKTNFYMIGSMGLASSIAAGVAVKNPQKRVFVFDGDGNILMNLGSLVTIGSMGPPNLVHVVFDNGSHESTGGQPTNSPGTNLEKIAENARYKAFKAGSKKSLLSALERSRRAKGPVFILVKVSTGGQKSGRINLSPEAIRKRFESGLRGP